MPGAAPPAPKLLSLRRPTPVPEPPGVLFSALANTPGVRDDVFAASEPEPPTEGESLTPKAAKGSTRPPVSAAVMFPRSTTYPVGVCACDGDKPTEGAGDATEEGAVGGFGEGAVVGAGGGHVASDAGGLGPGGTSFGALIAAVFSASAFAAIACCVGSGNALSSSPSSFMNSRTDSSAVSTAKDTRLFIDCLRLFLAPAAAAAPGLAILDTSLRMERRRRLRICARGDGERGIERVSVGNVGGG